MISEVFDLPDGHAGLVTVRFWHAWEWDGAAINTKIERRLQLLDSEKQIIESQPLSYSDATWGSWTHEEVSFNAITTGPHRIALTITSKPSDTPQACSWTIDHVVVFAPVPEPQ